MNTENLIAQKMELIQSIFMNVQEKNLVEFSLSKQTEYLHSFDVEFRGIAYEAASMNTALSDAKTDKKQSRWLAFLNECGNEYAIQIHVGLGWALAQEHQSVVPFTSALAPMLRYRVLDGYGYYEGIFRKRKSIISKQKFETEDYTAAAAYDQGLGRSIWYSTKGNIDIAKSTIATFPADRQKDLWRGLGIAITYVGGCNTDYLKKITDNATGFTADLATGAAMTLVSRNIANSILPDTEVACNMFCHKTTSASYCTRYEL
jgi:hypothetical protein